MKKIKTLAFGFIGVACLSFAVGVAAKPNSKQSFSLPEKASEVAPGVFNLGKVAKGGRVLQGYAFVDYKKHYAKPESDCGNGICEPGENARKCPSDCGGDEESDTSSCYGFIAKGAKWKSIEPWIVNPSNLGALTGNFVYQNLELNLAKWEEAAGQEIVGVGSKTNETLEADTVTPDNLNEVYFADIDSPGAIGVTIVWGIFGGPPFGRELVEWDQVYDDVDFDWSETGEPNKMDFENIATHELGHTLGMDDLYDDRCAAVTMFGYASEGEINKRDLETGDIVGIQKLYQ